MDKKEKDVQISKKKLAYDIKAVEKVFDMISCQKPCANYPLCANGGGCYLRLGEERWLTW